MKRTKAKVAELEAELLRLNDLVRARRRQLTRLEQCPHKDCECRAVWRQVVEKDLETQIGKIRTSVSPNGKQIRASKARKRGRS